MADLTSLLHELDDAALRYGTAASDGTVVDCRVHTLHGEPPTVEALHHELLDRIAAGDALAFTWSSCRWIRDHSGSGSSSFLIPVATTSVRLRAPAPLR
jgi:hypothetical protein